MLTRTHPHTGTARTGSARADRHRGALTPMFEDRSYKRTFYSAPQSVTSLVAAFLEPTVSVAAYVYRAYTEPFADRLIRRTRALGHPLCVGIDPHLELLPRAFRRPAGEAEMRRYLALFDQQINSGASFDEA